MCKLGKELMSFMKVNKTLLISFGNKLDEDDLQVFMVVGWKQKRLTQTYNKVLCKAMFQTVIKEKMSNSVIIKIMTSIQDDLLFYADDRHTYKYEKGYVIGYLPNNVLNTLIQKCEKL